MLFLFSPRTKHYSKKSSTIRHWRKENSPQSWKPSASLTFSYEFHFFKSYLILNSWFHYRTPDHLKPVFYSNSPKDQVFVPLKRCKGSVFWKGDTCAISHCAVALIQKYFLVLFFKRGRSVMKTPGKALTSCVEAKISEMFLKDFPQEKRISKSGAITWYESCWDKTANASPVLLEVLKEKNDRSVTMHQYVPVCVLVWDDRYTPLIQRGHTDKPEK